MSSSTAHPRIGRPSQSPVIKGRLRDAKSHSKLVQRFRILFPAGFTCIALALILITFDRSGNAPILKDTDVNLGGNGEVVMQGPVMDGVDGEGLLYSIKAANAVQQPATPDQMDLDQLVGLFNRGINESKLVAQEAKYFRDKNFLNILSQGKYLTADGKQVEFSNAEIDVSNQYVDIKDGVRLKTPTTFLDAETAVLDDQAKVYKFQTRVKATLLRGAQPILPVRASAAEAEADLVQSE